MLVELLHFTASRGRLDTGGVVIQPVEDEELGDLSSRRIAAVRFVGFQNLTLYGAITVSKHN